jgi:tetratricopeptide (TPR) repeat protein
VALASAGGCLFPANSQEADRAQSVLDRVAQFVEAGDLKQAENILRRAIQSSPKDPRLLSQLGSILGIQNRLQEASSYFQESLKLNPGDITTRRYLAANQWRMGDLAGAQQNLERILKTRPGDRQSLLLLGMVVEDRKDYPRAAGLLASVPELVGEHPEAVAALARAYYRIGETEMARNTLATLEHLPTGPEGVFLGGQIASASQDYTTAERLFRSIQRTYPDTVKLGLCLAESQFRSEEFDESQRTLLALIDVGHRSTEIYNMLSWCYERLGNLEDALRAMDEAILLNSQNEFNYVDLAIMLNAHQLFKIGLEAAKRAVEVAPHSVAAWRIKAQIEVKLYSSFDQAANTYREAIERNNDSPDFVRQFALAEWDQQLIKEATETFESGIRRFPSDPRLKVDYGRMLLRQLGNDDAARTRAISLFKTALALDDSLADAHFEMGQLALGNDQFREALRHLQAAARLEPAASRSHYRLISVYLKLGREADAACEAALFEQLRAREDRARPGPMRRL